MASGVAWDLKIGYSSETATQAPGHGLRSIVSCCYVCLWALGWLRMREAQVTALGLCFCLASLRETEYLLSWALEDGGALSSSSMTPVIVRKMGGSFFFFFFPFLYHIMWFKRLCGEIGDEQSLLFASSVSAPALRSRPSLAALPSSPLSFPFLTQGIVGLSGFPRCIRYCVCI